MLKFFYSSRGSHYFLHAYASENITARLLTTRDGLPNNTVRNIMQDRKGFIWLSTLDGIARYDGYKFINYHRDPSQPVTLTDQSVRSAFEDANGFIWICGANDHIDCLDPRTGAFIDLSDNGVGNLFRYVRQVGDDVWLWGEYGAMKVSYTDGEFVKTRFGKKAGNLPSDRVNHLGIDHKGRYGLAQIMPFSLYATANR